MEDKKILIIGAGISGLSLAIKLKNTGIPFRIIEKQTNWSRKGLAMSIQGEGIEAAGSLGILDEIQSHGVIRNLKIIETPGGKILKELKSIPGDYGFVIPRDIIHEALRLRIPNIEMGLSAANLSEQKGSLKVTFSNGSIDSFSLVVGADGVNSRTLNLLTEGVNSFSQEHILYSGSVIWGITTDKKYDTIMEVWGNKNMCAMYPLANGTVFSFFKETPFRFKSPVERRAHHLRNTFGNYTQDTIKEVMDNLPENLFFDHIRNTRPKKWNKGRVTLIGDACHSLSPLSGLGANLAMADAVGLAGVIKKYINTDDLVEELKKFNKERKEKADSAYFLGKYRTHRGMTGFPWNIVRNTAMKSSKWLY